MSMTMESNNGEMGSGAGNGMGSGASAAHEASRIAPDQFAEPNPAQVMEKALDDFQRILVEQRVRLRRMQKSQGQPAREPAKQAPRLQVNLTAETSGPYDTFEEARQEAQAWSRDNVDKPFAIQTATNGKYWVLAAEHVCVTKLGLCGTCLPSREELHREAAQQAGLPRVGPGLIGVQTGSTRTEALGHLEEWRTLYPAAHFTLVRFAEERYAIIRDLAEVTTGGAVR